MSDTEPAKTSGKPQRRKQPQWPGLYKRTHRGGQVGYVVDLGLINGKRNRRCFATLAEARTFAEQARIAKRNEGTAAFSLDEGVRVDAAKAYAILKPAKVSLLDAAEYYRDHMLAYLNAPTIAEMADKMVAEAEQNDRRSNTVAELRQRLGSFAADFSHRKLSEITLEELKDWIADDEWSARTRINCLTKISQLFNYAVKHRWVDANLTERIDRPSVEDKEPGILTVTQAEALLTHANQFGLLPFVAIGLFAGLRTAELLRLQPDAINIAEHSIVVGQSVAKKRSRRVVEMGDALGAWLATVQFQDGTVVGKLKLSERLSDLRAAAGILIWPHNALRHSFGSYHLAFHGDATKTAYLMGHKSTDVIHNHYKALVLKSEAEKFWALRPKEAELGTQAKPARKLVLG